MLQRKYVVVGGLSLSMLLVGISDMLAQRVAADTDPIREYAVALELYQKQKYGQAQERFAKALQHKRSLPSIQQENAVY